MSTPPPGRFARLARKELTEILRDRRTVLTLVLMPLLLYPLMAVVFRQFLISGAVGSEAPTYKVGFTSEEEGQAVFAFLKQGEASLARRGAFKGEGNNERPDAGPRPKLVPFMTPDLSESVAGGNVDVGVRLLSPGGFLRSPHEPLAVDLELLYRDDSERGLSAAHFIERLCREENANYLARRLAAAGIDERAAPVRPLPVRIKVQGAQAGVFAVLLPLVLILMTITGAVYPAIDLTAGERERGTLEVLIAAPVRRSVLLGAKYVAVVVVAVLTAVMNLASMTMTLWATGLGQAIFADRELSLWLLPEVFGLLLLLAAFFSGVLLAITSFARSFKEAQAYLIPLMLASLMPGMVGFMPGLKLEGPLAVVPLINIVLLARDLLNGHASAVAAVVVVLTTAMYAVAAVAVAARTFGAEAVLYAQQGSWGEMFQRPRTSRPAARPAAALLCLAMLFPASIAANRLLGDFLRGPVTSFVAAQAVATVVLFGAFPAVAAWLGRVQPRSAFRLAAPGVAACGAGILLGLSLWPLVQELLLALRAAGIDTVGEAQQAQYKELLERLREAPPLLVLFALGALTPLLEEFFFRGYLLSALLTRSRPVTAVLTSAVLFGAFHLISGGGLAVEKMIASALLGVVLGWLAWKSGSVVPGMLLHGLHNSLLVALGLYEPWLQGQGWNLGVDDHLPPAVLLGGVAGSLLGALVVWLLPVPKARQAAEPSD